MVLSLKFRVAVRVVDVFVPNFSVEVEGETTRPVGTGGPTVSGALPLTDPDDAEMVTAPGLSVVTSPVGLTTASVASEVDHSAVVSTFELPSEKLPVAVN